MDVSGWFQVDQGGIAALRHAEWARLTEVEVLATGSRQQRTQDKKTGQGLDRNAKIFVEAGSA